MRSVFAAAAILAAALTFLASPASALEIRALSVACKGNGVLSAINQGLSREINYAKLLYQSSKGPSDVLSLLSFNSNGGGYNDMYLAWDKLACQLINTGDPAAAQLVARWAQAVGTSPGNFGTTVAFRHYVRLLENTPDRFRLHILTPEEKQLVADTAAYMGRLDPDQFAGTLPGLTPVLSLPPPSSAL